jgi:2-isopropylmalate synthase
MSLNSDDPNHFANIYNQTSTNKDITILDSTLREGEQHPGVSFTNKQRIQIAWLLDSFGVKSDRNQSCCFQRSFRSD